MEFYLGPDGKLFELSASPLWGHLSCLLSGCVSKYGWGTADIDKLILAVGYFSIRKRELPAPPEMSNSGERGVNTPSSSLSFVAQLSTWCVFLCSPGYLKFWYFWWKFFFVSCLWGQVKGPTLSSWRIWRILCCSRGYFSLREEKLTEWSALEFFFSTNCTTKKPLVSFAPTLTLQRRGPTRDRGLQLDASWCSERNFAPVSNCSSGGFSIAPVFSPTLIRTTFHVLYFWGTLGIPGLLQAADAAAGLPYLSKTCLCTNCCEW